MTIWAPAAHSGLAHGMGIYITRRYTKNENKIRGIQREIVLPNGFSDFPRGCFLLVVGVVLQALVKKKKTLYPTTVTTVTSCSSIYRIERKEGLGLRESVRGSSDRETTLQPASQQASKQPVDVQLEHVIRNWSNSGSASSMTRKSCIVHCVLNIMMMMMMGKPTILWDHQSRSAFPPNPDRYHTVQAVKAGALACVRRVESLKREHRVTCLTSQPPRRYWLKA